MSVAMGKYANLSLLLLLFLSDISFSSFGHTFGAFISGGRHKAKVMHAIIRSLGGKEKSNSTRLINGNTNNSKSDELSPAGRLSETAINSSRHANSSGLVDPTASISSSRTEKSMNTDLGSVSDTNRSSYGVPPGDKMSRDGVNETDTRKEPEVSLSPQFEQPNVSAWRDNNQTDNHALSDNHTDIYGNCEQAHNMCTDGEKIIACVKNTGTGSENSVILVLNKAETFLKVNLTLARGSNAFRIPELEIPPHQIKMVNISSEGNTVILNAGGSDCALTFGAPLNDVNFFLPLPPELITSINGAYLLLATVLVLGGTLVWCRFRNRRRHGGNQYQEVEMGRPDSASLPAPEAADEWDNAWDDDWEGDKAPW